MSDTIDRAWSWVRGPSGAVAVFVVALTVAVPTSLALGGFRWFFLDDWAFLAYREANSLDAVLGPWNDHWVSLPMLSYRLLYHLFGITSYVPYETVAILWHLVVVVTVRAVIVRCGVRPWWATGFASVLVVFGPGSENIATAFQITFTGALALGLTQLLLADHPGRWGRRDLLAVFAGLGAVACSGVALPVVGATGVVVLVNRGWRRAAATIGPVFGVYLLWLGLYGLEARANLPSPSMRVRAEWLDSAIRGAFLAFGDQLALAMGFALILIVGLVLVARQRPGAKGNDDQVGSDGPDGRFAPNWRALVTPLALIGAAVVFALLTGQTRWFFGSAPARTSRYVYIYVALLLPALALAGQAVVDRWRRLGPVVAAALIATIVLNAMPSAFLGGAFDEQQHRILSTVVLLPEARQVPPDVRPLPLFGGQESASIGFLLEAFDSGRFEPDSEPLTDAETNAARLRLGFSQRSERRPDGCEQEVGTKPKIHPVGTRMWSTSPLQVLLINDFGPRFSPVFLNPTEGALYTVELPRLRLKIITTVGGKVLACPPA